MAAPFLWGAEFNLPTNIITPSVTVLSNGTFLVLGKSGLTAKDKIKAWIYNTDGSLKKEQIIDIGNSSHDWSGVPVGAELADGRIVITWGNGSPSRPWFGLYDANLTPLSEASRLYDPGNQNYYYVDSITSLDDGGFAVSYRSPNSASGALSVHNVRGTLLQDAKLEHVYTDLTFPLYRATDLASLSNGAAVVVLRKSASEFEGHILLPQGSGSPDLLMSFPIPTFDTVLKGDIKVAALEGGGFVVAWSEQGPSIPGPDFKTFAQVYGADAKTIGERIYVGGNTLSLSDLDLVATPNGGFAVTYEKPADAALHTHKVYLALFNQAGGRVGDEFLVSDAPRSTSFELEDVFLMADGRFLIQYSGALRIVDPRSEAVSLKGTAGNDQYIGTAFNDTFDGGAGADRLDGRAGVDFVSFSSAKAGVTASLNGGGGGDAAGDTYISIEGLLGSSFADVFTGNGSAILKGRGGDDTYYSKAGDTVEEAAHEGRDTVTVGGSYALRADAEVEVLKLSGVSSKTSANLIGSNTANEIIGHGGKNSLRGLSGNDVLKASSGNDTLKGDAGSDTLHGGFGNDKLYGGTGTGRDAFVFDTKPSKSTNVDRIYDFNPKYDSIQIENKIFTKLGKDSTKGVKFKADMFVKSDAAKDKEDRIIYDNKTGALYYDQDGTGSKAQVKIAALSKNLKLTHHDFFVI